MTADRCTPPAGRERCAALHLEGLRTLLVPDGTEVTQTPGSTELVVKSSAGDQAALAWSADGRNLLLATSTNVPLDVDAPQRLEVVQRYWLTGDESPARASDGRGLAHGWYALAWRAAPAAAPPPPRVAPPPPPPEPEVQEPAEPPVEQQSDQDAGTGWSTDDPELTPAY